MSIQLSVEELANIAADSCASPVSIEPLTIEGIDDIARVLSSMGDPARLQILDMISRAQDGEICACSFVAPLKKAQPTISHHLKVLTAAGLIRSSRRGKWIWYSLNDDRLRMAIDLLENISSTRSARQVLVGQDSTR